MKTHPFRPRRAGPLALLLAGLMSSLPACHTSRPDTASGPLWRVEPASRSSQPESGALGESYYRLGRYYAGQSRWSQAEEAYRRALLADPRHAEAFNALGVLQAGQGRLGEAIATLTQAAALLPARSHILSNLGYAYWLAGQPAEARQALSEALRLDPDNARAAHNLQQVQAAGPVAVAAASASEAGSVAIPVPVPALQPVPEVSRLAPVEPAPAGMPDASVAAIEGAAQPADAPVGAGWLRLSLALSGVLPPAELKPAPLVPGYRLEIANGMGVRGAARRMNAMLMRNGAPAAYLTDMRPFRQGKTEVFYSARYQAEAERLAERLGAAITPDRSLWRQRAVHLRVVLGKDIVPLLRAGSEAGLPELGLAEPAPLP